ncbi:type II toxin-antitoxin system HicA family toxin [Desulfobacterales bacterium HSG2]|nr:type II toxin-antitoxin system HicA family toxin [Desulfobacterales bacterium HSG2]
MHRPDRVSGVLAESGQTFAGGAATFNSRFCHLGRNADLGMNYREAVKRLRKLGCQEIPRRSGGSHRKWHNPISGGIVPIPNQIALRENQRSGFLLPQE